MTRYYTDGSRDVSPRPLPRRSVDSLPRWVILNLAIFVAVWIIFGGTYAVIVESVGGGGVLLPLLAAELWPVVVGASLVELALVAAWLLPGLAAYLFLMWRLRTSPQARDWRVTLGPLATCGALLAAPTGVAAYTRPAVAIGLICTGLVYGLALRT